jgi:hypothetical protein
MGKDGLIGVGISDSATPIVGMVRADRSGRFRVSGTINLQSVSARVAAFR